MKNCIPMWMPFSQDPASFQTRQGQFARCDQQSSNANPQKPWSPAFLTAMAWHRGDQDHVWSTPVFVSIFVSRSYLPQLFFVRHHLWASRIGSSILHGPVNTHTHTLFKLFLVWTVWSPKSAEQTTGLVPSPLAHPAEALHYSSE